MNSFKLIGGLIYTFLVFFIYSMAKNTFTAIQGDRFLEATTKIFTCFCGVMLVLIIYYFIRNEREGKGE